MINNRPRIGQELLDVPMGDMIREMAFAIAEAQMKLDENSIDVAEMMGGLKTITDDTTGEVTFQDSRVFFGQEKMTGQDAISLHNTTNDISLKAQIRTGLGIHYSPTLLTTAFTNAPVAGDIDPGEYAIYQGLVYLKPTTAIVTKTLAEFQIAAITSTPATNSIIVPRRMSMMELGFTPTFYQFVDTIIEVKISIKYTQEGESSISVSNNNKTKERNMQFGLARAKRGRSISTSQVNASYSQKYSYSAEGSSLLRTKLVPIPPPVVLEDRIRRMMEEEFTVQPAPTT